MATPSPDMQISPQRAKQLLENLSNVARQIQAANKASRPVSLRFLFPVSASIQISVGHTAY